MGPRCCLTLLPAALVACGPAAAPQPTRPAPPPAAIAEPSEPAKPATMADRVVANFETAIKSGPEAYVALFDFAAIGELEILLHRYDLLGRLPNLPDDIKAQFAAEDGTPYPAERERTNVGKFYNILAKRTIGSGGCVAVPPRTRYAKLLATFEPLPPGTPPGYEALRAKANAYVAKGGLVAMRCRGGRGGIALVWTERPNARGYDLITIYDD